MNNVQILGTITRDIELKYTQNGSAIASFGIAYNEKRKQQDGSYNDIAHFFDVTAFGRRAETVNQWFRKGSKILINGSLDYQSWEKDGQKRSKVGIKLNDFDFIDKKDDRQANQPPQQWQHQQQPQSYQQPNQANQPPVYYENAQGRPTPPPQHGQRVSVEAEDTDHSSIPF